MVMGHQRRITGTAALTNLALEGAAHVVQLALTPVFLLSGIASLATVFSTRHGRV